MRRLILALCLVVVPAAASSSPPPVKPKTNPRMAESRGLVSKRRTAAVEPAMEFGSSPVPDTPVSSSHISSPSSWGGNAPLNLGS